VGPALCSEELQRKTLKEQPDPYNQRLFAAYALYLLIVLNITNFLKFVEWFISFRKAQNNNKSYYMPLKALTLDLWLTLIWDSSELEKYRRLRRLVNFYRFANRIHRDSGIKSETPFRFSDVRLALETLSKKSEDFYERGEDLHPKDRGRMLFDLLKIKVEEKDRDKVFEDAGKVLSNSGYMRRHPNLNPEARPTLRAFRKEFPKLKIALISNAARSTQTYSRTLKALGIGDFFDHFVISCEIGYLKPRKEIFSHALDLLDVEPEKALHVGDLFRADVVGATTFGMNACLYTGLWKRYSQLESVRNPKNGLPPPWAGERIPKDFKPKTKVIVKEIEKLQQALDVAKQIS
jgi:HAD superfamily hydrolase (TIGR01509 family)